MRTALATAAAETAPATAAAETVPATATAETASATATATTCLLSTGPIGFIAGPLVVALVVEATEMLATEVNGYQYERV